jgi:hypothetical protein
LFIVLGYALHFPVRHVTGLASADAGQWRSFLAVDVLQLIGVTFLGVQMMTLVLQSRRVFMAVSFALAILMVGAAPAAWTIDWSRYAPPAMAAYLSPSAGSLFPVVPWSACVLIGATAGGLYARWGAAHLARFATWVLIVPGALVVLFYLSESHLPRAVEEGPFGWVPLAVLTRIGACLIVLGAVAHASRFITHLPHVFGTMAQESLLIYVVHLCLVYGSPWNKGLYQFYGESLTPPPIVLIVVALIAAMTLLAWQWNRLKHHRPRTAQWIYVGGGAVLVSILL